MSSSKMVLVQVNSLALGGTQLNAVDLALAVRKFGFESVLYGPADTLPLAGPSLLDVATARGVKTEAYQRAPDVFRSGAAELEGRARAIDAELIHLYGADAEPRTAYWGPCRGGRRPFVHTVYEMSVEANSYRHNSLIIGTGYLRDELVDRPGRTTLISPPVDMELDAPSPDLAREFRARLELTNENLIVIVSRLDKAMKAYPAETAIRAMPYLRDRNVALVVVGSGSEEDRLVELGRRINESVGRRIIRFTGALADPRPAYAAADVVLGMGGSAARSLAFGRALIVQGERGTAEVFAPESSASLFRRSFWNPDPQTNAPERLADTLAEIFDPPHRRDELGSFGRDFARANFSLTVMAERLAAVYMDAMNTYGRLPWLMDLPRERRGLTKSVLRRVHGRRD